MACFSFFPSASGLLAHLIAISPTYRVLVVWPQWQQRNVLESQRTILSNRRSARSKTTATHQHQMHHSRALPRPTNRTKLVRVLLMCLVCAPLVS